MQNKRWRDRIRREEVWSIITVLVGHQCCTEEFYFTLNTLSKHTQMLLHKQVICSCVSNSVSYAIQAVVKTQAINKTHFWSKEEGNFLQTLEEMKKARWVYAPHTLSFNFVCCCQRQKLVAVENYRKLKGSFTQLFVILYLPSSCSKPALVYFLFWAQKKTFWRMWVTKQLTVSIDFHSMGEKYYASQWLPSTVWLLTSLVLLL